MTGIPWLRASDDGYAMAGGGYDEDSLSPECETTNHIACAGKAWDWYAEDLTPCACGCHRARTLDAWED